MKIERHFINVQGRRVHFRKAGNGPPVLLIHQNPRSSSEMEGLMARWADSFTCIAPDTAGLGLSDPLPDGAAIDEIADSLIEFMDAAGLAEAGAFGFHSGAVQLMAALRRHPSRFSAVAMGGYGLWSRKEQERFGDAFVAPFVPRAYGEHLSWLWWRLVEQGWFFPWHEARMTNRLATRPLDVAMIDELAREWLEAGDHYRQAFGGCLRAPRALPEAGEMVPPTIITAYEGDPLREHFARAGDLPNGWIIRPVDTPGAQEEASREFLLAHAQGAGSPSLRSNADHGFGRVAAAGFDGLIHWKGDPSARRILLHAPGAAMAEGDDSDALHLDLPGHGLSDHFAGEELADWARLLEAAIRSISRAPERVIVGSGPSVLLALAVASRIGAVGVEAREAHIPLPTDSRSWLANLPDLGPDRFGGHLGRAWGMARSMQIFWPWFAPAAAHAIPFADDQMEPEALAKVHLRILRARHGGPALLKAVLGADRDRLLATAPPILGWHVADWAAVRSDIWRPQQAGSPGQASEVTGC